VRRAFFAGLATLVRKTFAYQVDLSSLATTMLAGVLLRDGRLVYAQVGDGAIVARRENVSRESTEQHVATEGAKPTSSPRASTSEARASSSLVALTEPQGEYVNESIFLTSSEAFDVMQIGVDEGPIHSVAAFTDGLTHMALDLKAGEPRESFLGELLRSNARLAVQHGGEQAGAILGAYLRSETIRSRTRDDVTLLSAFRRRRKPQPPVSDASDESANRRTEDGKLEAGVSAEAKVQA
jgi:hypothetical protein